LNRPGALVRYAAAAFPRLPDHTPGSYLLLVRLPAGATFAAGRLPSRRYPAGWYLYTGSALGGLKPRLNRYLNPAGNRWSAASPPPSARRWRSSRASARRIAAVPATSGTPPAGPPWRRRCAAWPKALFERNVPKCDLWPFTATGGRVTMRGDVTLVRRCRVSYGVVP